MSQNNNILQELKELGSSLSGHVVQPGYSVPDGYFESLAQQVLNRIKASEAENAADELNYLSPVLSTASKQLPYEVPVGYFEGLEERMLQSVLHSHQTAAEELESISPLLSGLNKDIPYSVPQGYFENLAPFNKKATTKVVSMAKRSLFRYAAAAVVIGIVATVGLLFLNRPSFERFEAKLNKEIKKTSDKELNDFITYTEGGQDIVLNEPKEEVKELLKDVPATELQNFLDEIADPEITPAENSTME
ncbi:MAG TPA: hypothetical protein VF487_12250 [Chitinophagaceae bacterium]